MNVKLKVIGGEAGATEIELQLPAVLGRGRESTVHLSDPLVSRRHCEIYEQESGRLAVRDLGSLNGTFVGSQSVGEAVLNSGDLLTVGTVTFRTAFDVDEIAEAIPVADSSGDTVRAGIRDTAEAPRGIRQEA